MRVDSGTKPIVSAELYDSKYYLDENDGFREYREGFEKKIHPKFLRALNKTNPEPGMRVLDLGCGRGELSFYLAKRGCEVTSVDYSDAAVKITQETVNRLEPDLRKHVHVKNLEASGLTSLTQQGNPDFKYDLVYMVDFVEHVYPWQLEQIIACLGILLKPQGTLFISTPNALYEEHFYRWKKMVSWPFTVLKMASRLLRRKIGREEFWLKVNRFSMHRDDLTDEMHVNVMSPYQMKQYLGGWQVRLECDDHSKNLLSLLGQRWFGREIVVLATPPSA